MHGFLGYLEKGGVWIALAVLVGCNSTTPTFVDNLWPFQPDQRTSIATPADRIEDFQALAARGPSAPADEQQQTSANLAEQIRVENDPLIREEIIRAIAQYQTPLAAAVVVAGLKDADSNVRIVCCQALGRRADAGAVAKLGDVLGGDTDVDVRLAAAKALGNFKGPETVSALAIGLDDQDPALQYQAVQSLRQSTGKSFNQDANAWREFARGETPTPPKPISMAQRARDLWPF